MTQSNVTAIVINWKLKEETLLCLKSLENSNYPCNIITVDNGSNDGSKEFIETHVPGIDLIALPKNIGFGPACNLAITRALQRPECEYIFLVNNDATINPRAVSLLVKAAQENQEYGIFGPKIYFEKFDNMLWYAGARRRRGVLAPADTGRGKIDNGQFNSLREVDYVFGAAMFIRRGVFEKIGFFDERFFLYMEDIDFCIRTQEAGCPLLFVPYAHVQHQGSASTTDNRSFRRYHFFKSCYLFLNKYLAPIYVLPALGLWVFFSFQTLIGDWMRID